MTENSHENVVSLLATHLVALGCLDRTPGAAAESNGGIGKPLFFTAFLLDVDGLLLLVTAGHIIKAIEDGVTSGRRFERWEIHDGLSSNSVHRHPIPFVPDASAMAHWSTDDGADYGLIRVNDLVRAALKANNKKPIDRTAWGKNLPASFDRFFMLGLPTELETASVSRDGCLHTGVNPTLIPVDQLIDPPPDVLSPLPRFYGQLPLPLLNSDGVELSDIDGMSGGPIFGFKKTELGLRYWSIAIQSGWWKSRGIISACWLRPVAREIAALFD